jgi:hypothetical protein
VTATLTLRSSRRPLYGALFKSLLEGPSDALDGNDTASSAGVEREGGEGDREGEGKKEEWRQRWPFASLPLSQRFFS